jgi:hypothetical protein
MGSCIYYGKLEFSSEVAAMEALPRLEAFWAEGERAARYWQSVRFPREIPAAEFWEAFRLGYPSVYAYLEHADKVQVAHPTLNGLAGTLSFGEEFECLVVGKAIKFQAYTWHLADWDPLMAFLEDHLGAEAYSWVTEEQLEHRRSAYALIDESRKEG